MRTKESKPSNGGSRTRFALDCGGSLPLSPRVRLQKRSLRLAEITIVILVLAGATAVDAQYSLRRSSFSTIGGTSAGGTFSLHSAVGTTAAGSAAGGIYSVAGTPWSVAIVETPDAPRLQIAAVSGEVKVMWPSPSTGWVLQQNTNNVSSVNWSNVTATIQDDGTTKTLIVNLPAGNRFYRLSKSAPLSRFTPPQPGP